jgi:hypothetical protein
VAFWQVTAGAIMDIETVRSRERRMSNDEDLLIIPEVPEPRAGGNIGRIYVGIN